VGTAATSVVCGRLGEEHRDFYVVISLFEHPEIEIIHTGGLVDKPSASSSGRLAASTLSSINLDIFFMSTGAWSVSRGVSAPSLDKVELKRAAMEAPSSCMLLADSTKYGTFSKFQATALDNLDVIISDSELPDDTQSRTEELGVEMQVAIV